MWSSAPDGGCVGTWSPAARSGRGGGSRETLRRPSGTGGRHHRPLARFTIVRGSRREGPPRVRRVRPAPACHDRRAMDPVPPSLPQHPAPPTLPLAADGYPAASGVTRRPAGPAESARANRGWWDAAAPAYLAEHGGDLGDVDFLWCPEGLREADAHLLGEVTGRRVLEIGCGSAPCSRWLRSAGADPVALDVSGGMLARAAELNRETGLPGGVLQADAGALPLADDSVDLACSAFGGPPLLARRPYVETDGRGRTVYVEHHRTIGDWVRAVVGAGLVLRDLIEPEWTPGRTETWGQWSPERGALMPGTLILVCEV